MWFRILESKESKAAIPLSVVLLIGLFIVWEVVSNPAALNIAIPLAALLLGCAVGWVIGEAFLYTTGWGKLATGLLTAMLGTSVTLDAFKENASTATEKVLYLFSLIPISHPIIIDFIVWFTIAFVILFILSIGINYTRRKERLEEQIQQLQHRLNAKGPAA